MGAAAAFAKVGSSVEEPEQEAKKEVGKWLGASAGAGIGTIATAIPLAYGTSLGNLQTEQKTTELIKNTLKHHGVKGVGINYVPPISTSNHFLINKLKRIIGARYNLFSKNITLPKVTTPLAALHEAGHAVNAARMGRMAVPSYMALRKVLPAGMHMLGLSSILWGGKDNTIAKHAPYLSAAAGVPTLAEEAIATGRALSYLKKIQGWKAMLKNLPQGISQIGGYGITAVAAPAVAMLLAKKYLRNPAAKE